MVLSSADIVIENRRISQSGSSAVTICDVENLCSHQRVLISSDTNVTSPVFKIIFRL